MNHVARRVASSFTQRFTSKADLQLFLGRLFARMGVECSYFVGVFGTATYALGSDAFGISFMMLTGNLFIVLGTACAGPLVDRIGPRKTLLGTLILTAAVFITYSLFAGSFGVLLAFFAFWSMLVGFANTSFSSLPPYVVPTSRLQDANGLLYLGTNVAIIAGPMVGAAITRVLPLSAVFLMSAAFFAAGAAVVFGIQQRYTPAAQMILGSAQAAEPAHTQKPGFKAKLANLAAGFSVTFKDRFLAILFCLGFFGYFAFGAFDSLESIFYRDILQVPVEFLGWLTAAMGVGCVLGSAVMVRLPKDRITIKSCAVMLTVVGVGTVIYVGTSLWQIAAIGQLVTGFGFGMLAPTRDLLVQRRTPLAYTGRVMSVMSLGLQFAGVIPLFFAPFLADLWGVQAVLIGASIVSACVGLFFVGIAPATPAKPLEVEGTQTQAAAQERARGQ